MGSAIRHGDVRLCEFEYPDKTRPVVVLTRTSAVGYLRGVTVAPITTTIREIRSQVPVGPEEGLDQPSAVSLDHVSTVEKRLIGRLLGRLNAPKLVSVREALLFALELDEPSLLSDVD